MATSKKLNLKDIKDSVIRRNFEILDDTKNENILTPGHWRFVELIFGEAVTNYKFRHNLGFRAKDILLTSSIGAGTATFNYSSFTDDVIDITTSGACTIRFFYGAYQL